MPLHRYYLDAAYNVGQELCLEKEEGHHLIKVVRARPGDIVEVVNGCGLLATLQLGTIDAKKAIAWGSVRSITESERPTHTIILAQAIPLLPRLETIIEKATELGADVIALFPGENSERASFTQQQWRRLRAISIAAMKQCGRLFLPDLLLWPPIAAWRQPEALAFFGDLDPHAPYLMEAWHPPKASVAFAVGPEAGFSAREEEHLRSLSWQGVRLHSHILRTDTAPLAALALIHQLIITN